MVVSEHWQLVSWMQRPGKRKEQSKQPPFCRRNNTLPMMTPSTCARCFPVGSYRRRPADLSVALLIHLAPVAVAVSVTTQQKNFQRCTGHSLSPLFCPVSLELEALPSAGMARTAFSVSEDAPTTAPSNQWCLKKAMRIS